MNQGQVAVSAEGLRADGRRETELRKIVCRVGGLPGDGSAFFMLGNTHVVASVFGPHEQRGGGRPSEQCVVNVEVSVAAFAGQERKAPIRRDKRSAETAMLLEQVFEKVIEVDKFPRSEIRICVTVLCADGGMRAACVNAASLALAHAGVPMRELVAASGAALFAETLLADPTLREDAAGAALLVARGATSGRLVLCVGDSRLPPAELSHLLSIGMDAAARSAEFMRAALISNMNQLSVAAAEAALALSTPEVK